MAWYSFVYHLEADEFFLNALFLLFLDKGLVGKLLCELGDPAQSGFEWRCGVVNVVAIQAEAHLQAQCVTRTQPDGFDVKCLPGIYDGVPYFLSVFLMDIHFKATRAGVSGVGEYDVFYSGQRAD